jgi:hypothetical protein
MKKLFWGLFFIAAGIFVLFDQLVGFTEISLFSLLCTILLIPIFVKSIFKLNFAGILFPLAFLCIIYSEQLNLESITPIPVLLTALLGSIGLSIIFDRHHIYWDHHEEHFDQIINGEDKDEVNLSVNFGSSIKYVNSEDFKIAKLKCSFGAMKIYFDNAKIVGDNAVIDLDISFSGVELYIPKDWRIINKVGVSLGGVEQKNSSRDEFKKTVTLTGNVNLAGVEIFYI